jgi:hypothetical protein
VLAPPASISFCYKVNSIGASSIWMLAVWALSRSGLFGLSRDRGSGSINHISRSNNCGWKRRLVPQPPVEITLGSDLHIRRHAGPSNRLGSGFALLEMLRDVIGNNNHQIVIAVRAGVPTSGGAELVASFGMIGFQQAAEDLLLL